MSEARNPVVERYLGRFEKSLRGVPETDRVEILAEIENHIAEATAQGKELATVVETLGPAEQLAKAYRAELALSDGSTRSWRRFFTFAGIIATTSLPSFIIVVVLGAICFGFVVGGLASLVAGPLSMVLPDSMVSNNTGIPTPIVGMGASLLGAVMVAVGLLAGGMLYGYVRLLYKAVRRVVADVRTSPV